MTLIIVGLLALAAIFLVFSLIKKVVKLAFTALALLLLVAGLWYFSQEVEVPDSVRQAGQEAAERIKEGAGQVIDRAAEVVKDGADQAIDKAAEAAKEQARKAAEVQAGQGDEGTAEKQPKSGTPAGEPEGS